VKKQMATQPGARAQKIICPEIEIPKELFCSPRFFSQKA
jgi:hypothetical protein